MHLIFLAMTQVVRNVYNDREVISMRIISVRQGFASDHSSTSYEFVAIDKPLDNQARNKVSSLSSRANPTKRTVGFVYNVDGYDIPGGWQALMSRYYDVMYREEYDWTTLAIAFPASEEQLEELDRYAFDGDDGLGVEIIHLDGRVIVAIGCVLDPGAHYNLNRDYYEEPEEEEEDDTSCYEPDDALLNLLTQIRSQLISGDHRALYAVWEQYGVEEEIDTDEDEEEFVAPPVLPDKPTGSQIVEKFRYLLTSM